MKSRAKTNRATSRAFIAAAAVLAAVCVAPAAQAFTVQDSGGASGGQGYLDLDKPAVQDRNVPVSRFGTDNGQTSIKQGNTTLQFGQQRSFDQRYNTDNIFNPYTREGR
ncbi:MAG: hypothetical protein ACM3IH_01810 [Sphingobacteriales bacterium]|jgi:hypothetical protein